MSSIQEGALNAGTIQSVLDVLIAKNPASTWLISDGQDEKVIYFSTGGIRIYASDNRRISRLEDFLVQRRLVIKDQLQIALDATQGERKETLDEALDRMQILPRERFQEAVGQLIYLELCDVITWENAIFEFYEGNPPPQIFDQRHPAIFATLDLKDLTTRVKDWNQEWTTLKNKLYSERLRVRLQVPLDSLQPKDPAFNANRKFYKALDGSKSLREVSLSTGLGFPDAARLVREGLKDGSMRATLMSVKESSSPMEVLGEIERLEEALDKAINTILIHKRIAAGYEKIQEKDRASEHYHIVGNLEADAGRISKALENYRKAIALSPQNLAAHESLIRRLQDTGEEMKALEEIGALSRKLFSFGFVERAYESLRGVISKATRLFEVRLLFAEILSSMGRKSEAVKEYVGIINEKKRVGSLEGIDEIYRRILSLDPMHREARTGLSAETRRKIGKSVLWVNRIAGAAAGLIAALWLVNELAARNAWSAAEESIRQLASSGQCGEAMEQLRSIGVKYPGSLLGPSLLEVEKDLFRESFFRFEKDLERAAALREEGKFLECKEVYRSVQKANLVEAQAQRAAAGLRDVDAIINESGDLLRSAEFFLNAGSYEDAFVFCRKILDQYPEAARNLRVPFYIRSTPSGAEVKVNGTLWGYTPLWIIVSARGRQEVHIDKPGFFPQAIQGFANRRSPIIDVSLRKN